MPKSSSQSKKALAAAKAKGAVRAKTGCYTCRIRRKKCDEERTERDTCRTCERLRLECLGFGAKRPEWLRENHNVVQLRDKIKVFLASQGLIKGHSGTGSRTAEQGHAFLRLSGDSPPGYSSGSESPPSHTVSFSSDEDRGHRLVTSSIRDQRDQDSAWFMPGSGYGAPTLFPTHIRSDSPFSNSSYEDASQHQGFIVHHGSPNSLAESAHLSPAVRSSFSRWYHDEPQDLEPFNFNFPSNLNGFSVNNASNLNPDPYILYAMPTEWITPSTVEDSIERYVQMIAQIQYLLGDRRALPAMIWESYNSHVNSKSALTLLNKVYWRRQQHPTQPVLIDSEMHSRLDDLLRELEKGRFDDPDDAIAALHGVSMFLFDGGQGAWREFLKLASRYVKKVLHDPKYGNPKDALLYAPPKDAFIVKTAIWFDVLASITTQQPPTFIDEIRSMFNPSESGVYNPQFDTDPQCSMMSPMGCENHVVWALAETSVLADWKNNEDVKCRLSISELVIRAQEIDQVLLKRGEPPLGTEGTEDHDMAHLRWLASEIFRCSTRLFLWSVVNNDHPQVRQIQVLVDNTIEVFRNLFQTPCVTMDHFTVSRSVIRSTVFGIFLCGSLTHNRQHRDHLLDHIQRESTGAQGGSGEGVGNLGSIRKMLDQVWKESDLDPAKPVPWRRVLKDHQILLV
ncbi:hypothetical protein FA15DRAFT_666018 [Coprinopsis marcescibilis]|uniref:Zn(2)-C6 fungal-type domain-containing protein n=1 Tax=Coprinopsis marcescibilis TaxID=230819 RepID=A0A5C3L5G4_COPMA|nr:hypothetical protein FA15DRAFT_666018 [Coprinopsis marcescibilis]